MKTQILSVVRIILLVLFSSQAAQAAKPELEIWYYRTGSLPQAHPILVAQKRIDETQNAIRVLENKLAWLESSNPMSLELRAQIEKLNAKLTRLNVDFFKKIQKENQEKSSTIKTEKMDPNGLYEGEIQLQISIESKSGYELAAIHFTNGLPNRKSYLGRRLETSASGPILKELGVNEYWLVGQEARSAYEILKSNENDFFAPEVVLYREPRSIIGKIRRYARQLERRKQLLQEIRRIDTRAELRIR